METTRPSIIAQPEPRHPGKIPTKSHPVVRSRRPSRRPDLHTARRRAQRQSRMAEGHREAAPRVLDGREHGGSLAAEGRRPITRHIAVYPRKLTAANTIQRTRCMSQRTVLACVRARWRKGSQSASSKLARSHRLAHPPRRHLARLPTRPMPARVVVPRRTTRTPVGKSLHYLTAVLDAVKEPLTDAQPWNCGSLLPS